MKKQDSKIKEMDVRTFKHEHGTPNPIIVSEENAMLQAVDKALSSTSNSQTIGRNGEIPLRRFLERYLPSTLCTATGHFIPPSGKISPQIDIMILDSRYPVLSRNEDDSVLAMLHSVIYTIEVKTNVSTRDLQKMWQNSCIIAELASEIDGYSGFKWGTVLSVAFAYRSNNRMGSLVNEYIDKANPFKSGLDLFLLRLPDKDQPPNEKIGVELHFEPIYKRRKKAQIEEFIPTCRETFTPLSDLYYNIVQNSYYTLGSRNFAFGDIGQHIMNYMSWSTVPRNN